VRAVYSTHPFPNAHLIAHAVKRELDVPWIADFRDPWAGGGGSGIEYWLSRFLERKVVYQADRIIANTNLANEDFRARYPRLSREKVVTITNGYDEEDFRNLPEITRASEIFKIVYPGTIDQINRNPEPFLTALSQVIQSNQIDSSKVKVRFLGAGPLLNSDWFESMVRSLGLTTIVSGSVGRQPYKAALSELASASLLMVLNEPIERDSIHRGYSRLMVPAKVYEYMRLGRPILALCGEGAVPELLEDLDAGWWASPRDIEAISNVIVKEYRQSRNHVRHDRVAHRFKQFERKALAARLAILLDELVT
jgi:glycosyltransferase involved in cell wall biosynthesis